MSLWVKGAKRPEYQIPAEGLWFNKLALALQTNQVDEEVWNRQRPLWIEHLSLMAHCQNMATSEQIEESKNKKK